MIANYHAHTWRCNHATGTEREYVEAALERKLQIFGFSDHTPYPFPKGYDSWFRMKPHQLEGYVSVVDGLRSEYRDRIQIHIGLETEYYPKYFPELLRMLSDSGVEYLILGQHFIGNEIDAPYVNQALSDADVLKTYCRQTMDAMQTGCFTYFAHPDLVNFHGNEALYRQQVRQICREANACEIPLEINLLGMERGKNYPNRVFWEVAAEENCRAILGCDTHDPKNLLSDSSEQSARKMAAELGITLLDTVKLRKIN